MTLDERRALYARVMHMLLKRDTQYTVRVWDGIDGCWCDCFDATNVDLETALRVWCDRTENGTQLTRYSDIDYYCIFPADTKMLWSGDFTMRDEL